jgi:hypothetical protein
LHFNERKGGEKVDKQLLIEVMPVAFTILEEASEKNDGRMRIRGIFAAADEINGNGRVYKEMILDREIEKLKELIAEKGVFGEADHPEDGKSRISNTATMLTDIEKQLLDGRKVYFGEAVVLNTSKGKDLQEIIRAGGKVGVSSRGWGSLIKGNWQGKVADIVQEDFNLKTFDFVIGQSTRDAEVTQFFEQMDVINILTADESPQEKQIQKGGKLAMEIKTVDELKKAYPELCEQLAKEAMEQKEKEVKESLQKEFDSRILKEVEAKKEEIKKEVIEEIKSSDDFQAMIGTLTEIGKLIKPYISESAGEDEEDDPEEKVAAMESEIETLKGENKILKEQIENEKKAAETKEKVKKKIEEVTGGKEHEKLLVERLSCCKTVEEVDAKVAEEEAYIKKLLGEKRPHDQEKGKGQILNEDKQEEVLTSEQKRQRALAGIPEKRASA